MYENDGPPEGVATMSCDHDKKGCRECRLEAAEFRRFEARWLGATAAVDDEAWLRRWAATAEAEARPDDEAWLRRWVQAVDAEAAAYREEEALRQGQDDWPVGGGDEMPF
jgi:hypothetical protein